MNRNIILAHDAQNGKIYNITAIIQMIEKNYNGDWKNFAAEIEAITDTFPIQQDMNKNDNKAHYKKLVQLKKALNKVTIDRDDLGR